MGAQKTGEEEHEHIHIYICSDVMCVIYLGVSYIYVSSKILKTNRPTSQLSESISKQHIYLQTLATPLNKGIRVLGMLTMGWLRLVGCLKIYVSLQNIGLFCRSLLQKRPIFLSILLIVATPYHFSNNNSTFKRNHRDCDCT